MKKSGLLALLICLTLTFSGCSFQFMDSASMLRPPKTSKTEQEICAALTDAAGNQITLRYPRNGEYRSAIVTEDVDSDGDSEALVFYCASIDSAATSIALIDTVNGEWQLAANIEGPGGNVDRLLFGDVLPNGKKEIIIGWSVSTGRGLLTVYTFENGTLVPVEIADEIGAEPQSAAGYTEVAVCDIDMDGSAEILTATLNTGVQSSSVRMLKCLSDGSSVKLYVAGSCALDGSVTKYSEVKIGMLDDNHQALLIDSNKGTDVMVSEAVYWDAATANLYAPFNFGDDAAVSGTDRLALTACSDMDGDGTVEFPRHTLLAGYSEQDQTKFYRTDWYSYDSASGTLSRDTDVSSVIDTADGFYMLIPSQWNEISVRRDQSTSSVSFFTVERSMETVTVSADEAQDYAQVISVDEEDGTAEVVKENVQLGTELFRIRSFDIADASLLDDYGYTELTRMSDLIWSVYIYNNDLDFDVSYNIIRACFNVL